MSIFEVACPRCVARLRHEWGWMWSCEHCSSVYEMCGAFLLERPDLIGRDLHLAVEHPGAAHIDLTEDSSLGGSSVS